METNKILKIPESNIAIDTNIDPLTTTDNYVQLLIFDTSAFSSFALQVINLGGTNALKYKVETAFDSSNWTEVKSDTVVGANANNIFEDNCVGTKTRIMVKSNVGAATTTCRVFARLNPFASIV